jgi:hypothetical protein
MKVEDNGKYYFLPIGGKTVDMKAEQLTSFVFADDDYDLTLELHGDFKVNFDGDEQTFKIVEDFHTSILPLFINATIDNAKANRYGWLFLKFSDGRELIVEDGPYENWHFYVRRKNENLALIHLGGGVGSTFLFG